MWLEGVRTNTKHLSQDIRNSKVTPTG